MEKLMTNIETPDDKLSIGYLRRIFNGSKIIDQLESLPAQIQQASDYDIIDMYEPTKLDWRLRIRLWELITKVKDNSNPYNIIYNVDICDGICDGKEFKRKMNKDLFIRFIFSPIENFHDELDVMLSVTRDKMWRLLNQLEPVDKTGKVDIRAANMLLRMHEKLVDRKLGTVRHLVEMKKIQLNLGTNQNDDIEDLDRQIVQLREGLQRENGESKVIRIDETTGGVS
jgi:hypothetical protein